MSAYKIFKIRICQSDQNNMSNQKMPDYVRSEYVSFEYMYSV